MTITRSGTNQAYSDNWNKAFGAKGGKATISAATKSAPKPSLKKKARKAKAAKR